MAFQNPVMLPWRTTLDNVLLPLEIVEPHRSRLRREKAAYVEKAEALLAQVGLKGFGSNFPWQLSGGMQQRSNLCRALIHDPALLMLDEPFGALDAFTREELWQVMRDLHQEKRMTVILVTHDHEEAFALADRVVVLHEGRVHQDATPTTVWRAPATAFVAGFVGHNVTTAFGGRVAVPPDGLVLDPVGPVEARVAGRTVRRDGFRVEVALADGTTLAVDVADDGVPAPGTTVRIGLRPGAAIPLPPG